MRTLLPINPALGGYTLSLDPPLTDAQLLEFCRLNDIARVERTREEVFEIDITGRYFIERRQRGNSYPAAQLVENAPSWASV